MKQTEWLSIMLYERITEHYKRNLVYSDKYFNSVCIYVGAMWGERSTLGPCSMVCLKAWVSHYSFYMKLLDEVIQ